VVSEARVWPTAAGCSRPQLRSRRVALRPESFAARRNLPRSARDLRIITTRPDILPRRGQVGRHRMSAPDWIPPCLLHRKDFSRVSHAIEHPLAVMALGDLSPGRFRDLRVGVHTHRSLQHSDPVRGLAAGVFHAGFSPGRVVVCEVKEKLGVAW
jgi:hypothetical protein